MFFALAGKTGKRQYFYKTNSKKPHATLSLKRVDASQTKVAISKVWLVGKNVTETL
jgi:hypothetical protein